MKRMAWVLCLALAGACTPDPAGGTDAGTTDAGDGGGGGQSPFVRQVLDDTASDLRPLAMAVGPGDKVGVAYFVRMGTELFDIRFVEWQGGQSSTPEKVATVNLVQGVSVAYDASGKAAVAYLGGGSDQSVEWLQSDLAVSYRQSAGQWTEQIPVTRGDQATAGNAVSDRGFLVGLNPAIVFDGTKAYVAHRDGHDGQFPQQDWAGSDLELVEGGPTSWQRLVVAAGGNNKQAYGGHISMVMANGQPALVHDQVFGSADGTGQNVIFQRRNANGTWTAPVTVQDVGNTQLGASVAWDATLGYAVAVVERSSNLLTYTHSVDGVTWTQPDPVYQSGTGGWYPSLAVDPSTHEPHIAFYFCSNGAGANEGSCDERVDELRVTALIGGNWREVLVDDAGGWGPKLAFLSTGKRVVTYRDPASAALKLAVEP